MSSNLSVMHVLCSSALLASFAMACTENVTEPRTNAGGGAPSDELSDGSGGGTSDGKSLGAGGTGAGGTGAGGTGVGGTAGAGSGSGPNAGGTGNGSEDPVGCGRPDLILCEDFEGTEVGAIPDGWNSEGNIAVAADQARGERSLKVGAVPNGARWIHRDAASLGAAHWGRIYYRVQTPTPEVFVHSTLVELNGDGPDLGNAWYRVVDTVQDAQQNHQFLYNVQPASSGEFGKGSSYDWTFDGEWHCAEWHVDANEQRYRFFFDGSEVTQIQIDNGPGNYGTGADRTHLPSAFSRISVGWNNYQAASPGFVAWIDELAIGSERVGCE